MPKFQTKISVIIPNYNYSDFIIERIDSILQQTYPIYELIVLDDASTDDSYDKDFQPSIMEKIIGYQAKRRRFTIMLNQNFSKYYSRIRKVVQLPQKVLEEIEATYDEICSNDKHK